MQIRNINSEDYESVREIITQVHNLHFDNRPDLYKKDNPFNKEYFESLSSDNNSILLAAEDGGSIIGICIATVKEVTDSPVHKERRYICIEDICVDEKHRRLGIGKRLYDEIVNIAKRLKADGIELTVFSFNKDAMSFYERLGLEIKNIRYEQKF
ncbi:MAG: GNAT family N-acetyltransferase [Candidatus Saccharibacteria bacterium]